MWIAASQRRTALALLGFGLLFPAGGHAGTDDDIARAESYFARQPLAFEPNQGQTDPRVRFLARSRSGLLFLTDDEAVVALSRKDKAPETLRLRFLGARSVKPEVGSVRLPSYSNYLIGNDPSRWHTEIPHYSRIEYRGLYPGVDLVYYGTSERQIEYDIVLAPGADLSGIRLRVDGARRVRIDDLGNLRIATQSGELVQKAPVVYQEARGERRLLPGRYVKRGRREVGFEVEAYDPTVALVVDPAIAWASYIGGAGAGTVDTVNGVAVAENGANTGVWVTGRTTSAAFPIRPAGAPPVDTVFAGAAEAFVTRFDLTGAAVFYSTFLGGNNDDQGNGIAVLGGDAYVTGFTASSDFPTFLPAQAALGGGTPGVNDAFVSVLNPAGMAFAYSTYLGGANNDQGRAIDVNASREAFVVGRAANGFPTTAGSFQPVNGGGRDGFVARYSATGAKVWATYLGGAGTDQAEGVALDTNGVIVVGFTTSTNFPTQAPLQAANGGGGLNDAFITKMNLNGTNPLLFSTYYGGTGDDLAHAVSLSTAGIFVAGETSGAFPVLNPLQTAFGGGTSDAFAMRLTTTGTAVNYATYLGGTGADLGFGIAAEDSGYVTLTGSTRSANFPVVAPLPAGGVIQGAQDGFITSLVDKGCAVSYSTYVGGTAGPATEQGNGIAIGPLSPGRVYVGGSTSIGFPATAGSFQPNFAGGTTDGFVLRLDHTPSADVQVTKTGPSSVPAGFPASYNLAVRNNGPNGAQDVVVTDVLPAGFSFVSSVPGAPTCNFVSPVLTCTLSCLAAGAITNITVNTTVGDVGPNSPSITNTAQKVSSSPNDPNAINNTSNWSTVVTPRSDMSLVKLDSPDPVDLGANVTYTLQVTNNGPSTASGVAVTDTLPAGLTFVSANSATFTCGGGPVVNCTRAGTFPPSTTETITIVATAGLPGSITNTATVTASQPDPDSSNNLGSATTTVLVPSGALPVFAATATGGSGPTSGRHFMQWRNPTGTPLGLLIRVNKSTTNTSDCTFPTAPTGGIVYSQSYVTPLLGPKQSLPFNNREIDTTYCYSAWVEVALGVYSQPRTVKARAFDSASVSVPVRWAYSTGGTSVVAPGLSTAAVVTVSNDRVLHSMIREGIGAGEWPGPWIPPVFNGPAQNRPPVVTTSIVAGSSRIILVGTQDGVVQAIDGDTGSPKWTSPPLATAIQAAPAGMFTAFGGAVDQVFVGTRNGSGANRLFALNAVDGSQVGPAFDNGGGSNSIGIVSGGAALDYPSNRVFFTSRDNAVGSLKTLWAMDIAAGGITPAWSIELSPTDASPVVRGNRIYVGGNSGNVWAVPPTGVGFYFLATGDGPVRGFVFPNRDTNSVYFATNAKIWGYTDTGAGFTKDWKEATLPGGALPSTLLFARGTTRLYVGASDGKLYELDFAGANAVVPPTIKSVQLGDGLAVAGPPSLDTLASPDLVYVGTDAGVIYAVEVPLP